MSQPDQRTVDSHVKAALGSFDHLDKVLTNLRRLIQSVPADSPLLNAIRDVNWNEEARRIHDNAFAIHQLPRRFQWPPQESPIAPSQRPVQEAPIEIIPTQPMVQPWQQGHIGRLGPMNVIQHRHPADGKVPISCAGSTPIIYTVPTPKPQVQGPENNETGATNVKVDGSGQRRLLPKPTPQVLDEARTQNLTLLQNKLRALASSLQICFRQAPPRPGGNSEHNHRTLIELESLQIPLDRCMLEAVCEVHNVIAAILKRKEVPGLPGYRFPARLTMLMEKYREMLRLGGYTIRYGSAKA